MLITLNEYEQSFHGFSITDCVVRDRSRFTFVATRHQSETEVDGCVVGYVHQVLTFMRDDPPGDQWGWFTLDGGDLLHGGAALAPRNQFVGVYLQGQVVVVGSGVEELEDDVPSFRDGGPNRGESRRVKTIGGYAYVCGRGRSVGKRLDKNRWFSHTQAIPAHPKAGMGGFDDIDGFAEDDIYAVGRKADVWNWDGQRWERLAIPTESWTDAVCCAGDGVVYVGCLDGLLLAGRGDRWRVLSTQESSAAHGVRRGFLDMVWHEDRVWCSSDRGLWTIHRGRLERARLPAEIAACAGHLYVNDGVLLAAGPGGVAFQEGGEWHSILVRPDLEMRLRESRGSS